MNKVEEQHYIKDLNSMIAAFKEEWANANEVGQTEYLANLDGRIGALEAVVKSFLKDKGEKSFIAELKGRISGLEYALNSLDDYK